MELIYYLIFLDRDKMNKMNVYRDKIGFGEVALGMDPNLGLGFSYRNRTPQLPPFFVLPPFLFLVLSRISKILRKGGSWKILDQRRKLGSAVPSNLRTLVLVAP